MTFLAIKITKTQETDRLHLIQILNCNLNHKIKRQNLNFTCNQMKIINNKFNQQKN